MRVLHSTSLDFEKITVGLKDNPPYAILSHRWGENDAEVTFQELPQQVGMTLEQQKPGFHKIKRFAEMAADAGINYIWVDTCCIDKTSSAELTQSINSMFFWYRQAKFCYAYLADVYGMEEVKPSHFPADLVSFQTSDWFNRGWTLQELIAPKVVHFYSSSWELIGEKSDMLNVLGDVTGIHPEALKGTPLKHFSVAERMSWAAKRTTGVPEDMAYCLMGIFDVNMPLLYGEMMEKAFIRLQQEIIRSSDDQSVFCWVDETAAGVPDKRMGLLASHPMYFCNSKNIESIGFWATSDPFENTNKGLRVQFYLTRTKEDGKYIASLECRRTGSYGAPLTITLERLSGLDDNWSQSSVTQFARVLCARPLWHKYDDLSTQNSAHRTIYVRQDQDLDFQKAKQPLEYVRLLINGHAPSADRVHPTSQWDPQTGLFAMIKEHGVDSWKRSKQGTAQFTQSFTQNFTHDEYSYLVLFGLTETGSLWTIVRGANSVGDPFAPYKSYQCTGEERENWRHKEGAVPRDSMTKLVITAVAKQGEHFKTPIWILEVESNMTFSKKA
ncbi:hypothetical protein LTR95_013332 [Oleoguttula sp. CCFEE 5521]